MLEDHSDALPQADRGSPAPSGRRAGCRRGRLVEPVQCAQQRRLARPRRADHRGGGAGGHVDIHAAQHRIRPDRQVNVGCAQRHRLNCCRGGRPRPLCQRLQLNQNATDGPSAAPDGLSTPRRTSSVSMIRPITSARSTQAARAVSGSRRAMRGDLRLVERQHLVVVVEVGRPECPRNEGLRRADRRLQPRPRVFVVDDLTESPGRLLEGARLFAAAHDVDQRAELFEELRVGVGGGTGRRDAIEKAVELVVFAHDGLVEALHVGAAVVLRRQDAVVLELYHSLLDRHAGQPEFMRDLVAVDPIPRAQFARQYQVDDMRDHEVFFLDPILLGHGGDSLSRHIGVRELFRRFSFHSIAGGRASGTTPRPASGRSRVRLCRR